MDYTHYAAIDIGSNAVRLLIKRLENPTKGLFSKVVTLRVPLRLGQDAFTAGEISEKKSNDLKDLIRAYAIVMKMYDIKKGNYRCCATAAMREARNGRQVLEWISKTTDVKIDLISGTEEAAIVYNSHIQQMDNGPRNLVFVDVGGGSTEVSHIEDGELKSTKSYPIGTLRMLSGGVDEGEKDELRRDMELLGVDCDAEHSGIVIVGAGGNINKLYELAEIEKRVEKSLTRDVLLEMYDEMRSMSVEQRAEKYNLKPDRADVIVPAAELFLLIADAVGADTIEVPSTSLADGIIDDIYRRQSE
ncbi:MAG: Ppx/GppA family phosphatase [Bacteroidales bacterium]|nr:Ppx/GppA family phosphatase [Bacteroidales bacterium]